MVRVCHLPVIVLLLAMAGSVPAFNRNVAEIGYSFSPSSLAVPKQRLSPDAERVLRATIETGYLSEALWPDFKDHRADVRKFYESNEFALAWVKSNRPTSQALSLIAALESADNKGLKSEDYDGPLWAPRLQKLRTSAPVDDTELARFDLALTVLSMRYLSDLNVGRVNPQHVNFGFDKRMCCDLAEFLQKRVMEAQDISSAIAELEPPFGGYWRTQRALQNYLQMAREYQGKPLPSTKKPVHPGDSYPSVTDLAKLLTLLNDLPANGDLAANGDRYQEPLVSAVKHFQQRHGLLEDGVLTQATISELNVPLSRRVQQLQLTLERWRWFPHEYLQPPIVVNIPEFRLRALDENYKPALELNVVVGKAYHHRTPVFMKDMKYIIFRPYWDVPYSITRAELISQIQRDPGCLMKHQYEVCSGARVVATQGVETNMLRQLRAGKLRLRQRPGEQNALGLVKFVFPNEQDVYLHGTPAQSLFGKPRRDFSHGCIRVEHVEELAGWVLRNQPGWTADRIREAMNGETTLRVNLDKPIPVLIVYGTAVVTASGEVHFFDDIYGYDAELERVIEKGYPYTQ
jgi:L,D-transpeptidase YcbB